MMSEDKVLENEKQELENTNSESKKEVLMRSKAVLREYMMSPSILVLNTGNLVVEKKMIRK